MFIETQDAAEYLKQYGELHCKVRSFTETIETLRESMSLITSPKLDPNKVQTSTSNRDLSDDMARLEEMRDKLNKRVMVLNNTMQRMVEQIWELKAPQAVYSRVLMIRYIKRESLYEAAKDTGYSYEWIKKIHHDALILFERQHLHPEHHRELWTISE